MQEGHKPLFNGVETGQIHGKFKVAYRAVENGVPYVWVVEKGEDEFPEVIFHNTVEQTLADGTVYNCKKMTVDELLPEAKPKVEKKSGSGTKKD